MPWLHVEHPFRPYSDSGREDNTGDKPIAFRIYVRDEDTAHTA